ncbi:DegT/DnrJ/EryC1/StrS family aminotransferase [Luminiphilus sp.]|nr:DegT/DnrJ/EryC1/StrS family aminotransferase [Luminiphilus sp.]
MPFIDLQSQFQEIGSDVRSRIEAVLSHGRYIMGPEVAELEERLAEFTEVPNCISVSSGTDALLISLMALGIQSGDEVITTPFTFIATAEVIALLGARPVFVDVEADTANIDVSALAGKITERTKAIMPVSLYGQPADMDAINEIAAAHGGIPVIEDAAQSFGALYRGKKSCGLSTIGCTSFFPSKPLGCYGDGGAIFTADDALAEACREIRVHGQQKRYFHTRVGIGGRMDTMQCAIVLAKLPTFEWEVERRAEIGAKYNDKIDEMGLERIRQKSDRTSVFAQYTILSERRDLLVDRLQHDGIPTAIHYPVPVNEQPAYKDLCCEGCTPVASRLSAQVLSLPMSPYLTDEAQAKILGALALA